MDERCVLDLGSCKSAVVLFKTKFAGTSVRKKKKIFYLFTYLTVKKKRKISINELTRKINEERCDLGEGIL